MMNYLQRMSKSKRLNYSIKSSVYNMKSKLAAIKLRLAAILAKLGSVATNNGTLQWTEEGEDLRAGMRVYVTNENGEYEPAPDGEYTTEDGKRITVRDGVVADIVDPAAEVGEDEGDRDENAADPDVTTDGDTETTTDAIDAIHREINELFEIVNRLVNEFGTLREDVAKLKGEPSEQPARAEHHRQQPDTNGRFEYLRGAWK